MPKSQKSRKRKGLNWLLPLFRGSVNVCQCCPDRLCSSLSAPDREGGRQQRERESPSPPIATGTVLSASFASQDSLLIT
ncbi:hypothetical protein BYT27DRAFT_6808237 [Phlegmacium glaucopus]|nr:hypothetical protein BYT27DRAFT_6808237 [Phlegmacium glaucopus]